MGATPTGIRELNLVIVPVTDQDRCDRVLR